MKKTVLITGASRGIGEATALKFSTEYNVVVNYNKNKAAAEKVVEKIIADNGNAVAIKADVSDYEEVCNLIDSAKAHFGEIDCLINNAGISEFKLFQDISPADWRNIFTINVDGVFNTAKCLVPDMINKKSGVILNVSSIWGIVGASTEVHYSATKGAVIAMSKALAKELAPSGIRVNVVAPGPIQTDMNTLCKEDEECLLNEIPLHRMGTVEDISELLFFLASEKASFITGQVISPNGGFVI